MTLEERADFVLTVARVLFVNGQSTEQTLAAERLGDALGLRAKIIPRWGELQFQSLANDGRLISAVSADPTNVAMGRVASVMRVIEDLSNGRLKPDTAKEAIRAISQAPPAPTWFFTLGAVTGAAALAVIFGVRHMAAAVLIFVSADAGGVLRRHLGHYSANIFLQQFCASLLAGVIDVSIPRASH